MAHILIVDDDNYLRKLFAKRLKSSGHEVITARNGEEGLKRVKEDKPELMLLDLHMPVMDGYEVLRQLRDVVLDPPLKVIVVTAASTLASVEDINKAEMVLHKPVSTTELVTLVSEVLAGVV